MTDNVLDHLTLDNRDLVLNRDRDIVARQLDMSAVIHWLRPCQVKVLIVVDGLDFSWQNFGLRTFVETLLTAGSHVRFRITLAHINTPGAGAMMEDHAAIVARIPNFKFDNAAHFGPDKYDVVFLFGIATAFFGRGNGYPSNSLSDAELQAIAQFQNSGGGLFATGDHGALGKPLCHRVARARNMRIWDHTSPNPSVDEVSMGGMRRNDTNRLGHDATSQFDDQSDDIPQPLTPKMYSVVNGFFRYSFPHPLLCGPRGVIRVFPDHPHEGECIAPNDTSQSLAYTAPIGAEYPNATDAGPRPVPEVIATLHVLAGTTSGSKDPTQAHSFGGICAYDGHRAGVGRVVTDSTWHHFVNVNLIGDTGAMPASNPKRQGFLATSAGQAVLDDIKAYFRNLAVWLARPANISCMRSRLLWSLVYNDRVLEAVLTTRQVQLSEFSTKTLWLIGRHARDVLGRYASRCQSRRIILELFPIEWVKRFPRIDPWEGPREEELATDGVPWLDLDPLLDVGLGGALVAINEKFAVPAQQEVEKLRDRDINSVAERGAAAALEVGVRSFAGTMNMVSGLAMFRNPGDPGKPDAPGKPNDPKKPR